MGLPLAAQTLHQSTGTRTVVPNACHFAQFDPADVATK